MYGVVLMMAMSGGTDLPANDMFEPAPKMSQTAYRHRCHGCSGSCDGGCHGGRRHGCHGGRCHGCHGGCNGGGCHGGCHGAAYVGGCYGGHVGYAYAGYPGSGYASWEMPTTSLYTYYPGWGWAPAYSSSSAYYPAPLNGDNQAPAPAADNRTALPNVAPISVIVRLPAEARLIVDGTATRSTGETRMFLSPPVETGKDFHYTIRAEIERDGTMIRAEKDVTVRAGQENAVQFDQSSFTPEKK